MAQPNQETIHDLLVRNIPRELVMGLEEAKLVGAQVHRDLHIASLKLELLSRRDRKSVV